MKISDYLTSQPYQSNQQAVERSTISRQTSTFSQENTLNFTTREGDKVSISQSFSSAFALMSRSESSSQGNKQSLTAVSMQQEAISLHVEGDLNEEELADIAKLVKNLYSIATDFFNGDQDKALDGIGSLTKDMGTISNLSASFQQTQMISSYKSSFTNSYLPPSAMLNEIEPMSAGLQNSAENDSNEDSNEVGFTNNIIEIQWQQISAMLDLYYRELQEENADIPETSVPDPLLVETEIPDLNSSETERPELKTNDHATQMIHQMADIMEKHPRLSSFALPIANNVIDKIGEMSNSNDSAKFEALTNLKNDLYDQFNEMDA